MSPKAKDPSRPVLSSYQSLQVTQGTQGTRTGPGQPRTSSSRMRAHRNLPEITLNRSSPSRLLLYPFNYPSNYQYRLPDVLPNYPNYQLSYPSYQYLPSQPNYGSHLAPYYRPYRLNSNQYSHSSYVRTLAPLVPVTPIRPTVQSTIQSSSRQVQPSSQQVQPVQSTPVPPVQPSSFPRPLYNPTISHQSPVPVVLPQQLMYHPQNSTPSPVRAGPQGLIQIAVDPTNMTCICPVCNVYSPNPRDLKTHMMYSHDVDKRRYCFYYRGRYYGLFGPG